MNNHLIIVLGVSLGIFTIIKSFFGILGWYTKDFQDVMYRNRLDNLWTLLNKKSLYNIAHNFLKVLVQRIEKTIIPNKLGVIIIFFSLNYSLFWFASIGVDNSDFIGKNMGIHNSNKFMDSEAQAAAIFIGFVGLILDYLSLLITMWLIKNAANSHTIKGISLHIFLDIIIATMSALVFVSVALVIDGNYLPFQDYFKEQKLLIFSMTLGITSTIPSTVYFIIAIILILIWVIPKKVQMIISNIIYRLTTDDKPVLTQLGNILGGLAGIVGGSIALLTVFTD